MPWGKHKNAPAKKQDLSEPLRDFCKGSLEGLPRDISSMQFLWPYVTLGVGNVSHSKEKGSMAIYYSVCVAQAHYFSKGNIKVLITPSELQKKALGHDTYWPFQMHGFPVGFDYPANATILGQSGARKNPIIEHYLLCNYQSMHYWWVEWRWLAFIPSIWKERLGWVHIVLTHLPTITNPLDRCCHVKL